MKYGEALSLLTSGEATEITREGWNNENITVSLQRPDENSKMTKPYLYMNKYEDKFPITLSCESILEEDWVVKK